MKLYYHQTDGGAEYYSLDFVTCPDGSKEGLNGPGTVLRTDGDEIEVFCHKLQARGIKLIIHGSDSDLTPEEREIIRAALSEYACHRQQTAEKCRRNRFPAGYEDQHGKAARALEILERFTA